MNSRRQFLVRLGRAFLGAVTFGIAPFMPEAYAIAPLAVMVIVQTALSAASLFSHGGDGMESLLNLQVEMLKHIESELSAIEKGIQEIFNRIDELKEIIGELPEQIVIEQNRAAIQGLSARYGEIRDTYIAEGRVLTPQLAAEVQNDLISPLWSARDKLMSYPQPQFVLIPTICTACFVEALAMALANTPLEQTRQALIRYRRWFVQTSHGKSQSCLEGKIRTLQQLQHADTDSAHQLAAAKHVTKCYTGTGQGNVGSGNDKVKFPYLWYKCSDDEIVMTVVATRDATASKAANEMIRKHLLGVSEQPLEIDVSPQRSGEWESKYYGTSTSTPEGTDQCPGNGHMLSCTDYENAARTNASELSDKLSSNGLQLMSLHALKDAADHAISFIDKLDPLLRETGNGG